MKSIPGQGKLLHKVYMQYTVPRLMGNVSMRALRGNVDSVVPSQMGNLV